MLFPGAEQEGVDLRTLVAYGLTATHTRLVRSLQDITDDDARQRPQGLSPLIWQFGHIAVVDLGFAHRVDGTSAAPPEHLPLFQAGSGGDAAYPPLEDIRDLVNTAQRRLEEIAGSADLDQPVEGRNFKNVGEMLGFAVYHRGYHIGKIATLRALLRALLGKPRLFG